MSYVLRRKSSPVFGMSCPGLHNALSASRRRLANRALTPVEFWRRPSRRYIHQEAQIPFQPKPKRYLLIWSFICANGIVFIWWGQAKLRLHEGRRTNPPSPARYEALQYMLQNYTLSIENLREGRWHTILTNAISHNDLSHLLFNMMGFHVFTRCAIEAGLRTPALLALGVGSALASSMAALLDWRRKHTYNVYGLGASGVVSGVGTAMACMMPYAQFQLMFIPVNIPLWVLSLGYIACDMYQLNSEKSGIGHAAHLGGAGFGILFYAVWLRKFGGVAALWRLYMGRSKLPSSPPSPPRPPAPSHHQLPRLPRGNPEANPLKKQTKQKKQKKQK
ncbi:hypothetical protein F5Y04DRAFT_258490 [Hypomontagnella monticulosa]|nr:hypothetical protein F5Y04DRAFT_258490 [Hypomontagnella monticulosa]